MRRPSLSLSLLLASGTLALAAFACGGISDPTRNGTERVATVSGALTGTAVPANARVALVWRKGGAGGLEVGADVAIVGGKFTMNLVAPPDSFHAPLEADEVSVIGSSPPSAGGAAPTDPSPGSSTSGSPGTGTGGGAPKGASSSKAVPGGMTLRPKDNATGTIITQPMGAAFAGFVVYADTNGNSKLDLTGPYGDSPDTILGGNDDLILVHLQGGGQLDLEKLRDKSGILPTAGFNLAWDEGRWLPLNLVELKLNPKEGLPNEVCGGSGIDYPGSSGGVPEPAPLPDTPPSSSGSTSSGSSSGSSGWGGPYPAPGSPGLKCSPDGRSFTYQQPCPPPPPAPTGLCAGDGASTSACAGGYGANLGPGQTVPSGWPCAVSEPVDGGPAPDAGSSGSSTSSSGG
ncbi:MAG: hypothetical protein JST00_02040 [Deltaproteobacteria bacterium]|nr:hypothetical protein [Deltaproteobacteria bacterium]